MTISTLSSKEKARAANAKYYAANPEKVIAANAKWRAGNPEKEIAAKAKWRAGNPSIGVIKGISKKYKTPATELRQIISQELMDVKLLQLTLHRLIKEKGLNNEPERI